ncbi:hypothetical protein GE09DRAFT_1190678 [Coniochaeta sp. 2T2.1]|nr:hypothetical protein GE09DRAFT_1190678 [Coniochaeta sp. 2T2.1]
MVLQIPENSALLLGGSADSMADLPQQAFALTLSDDVLESMIKSVRNGQEIQLSLGDTPSFLFSGEEHSIDNLSPNYEYELFYTKSTSPTSLSRLPNPAMPILSAKNRNALLRRSQPEGRTKPDPKPLPTKTARPQNSPPSRPLTQAEKEQADIAALSAKFKEAEADKLENSTRIIEGKVTIKGGKLASGKAKLLSRPSGRSQPGSPALSGVGSPSLGPTSGNQAQEKAKKLRFPLIHELAVRDQSFGDLLPKWQGETEAEFHTHLEKVAHFDDGVQKWTLKQPCWKELDVYAYHYEKETDRQKAIDNAIKKYDRMRLGVSDPLWQKLLPVSDRGKGICLSKVQAAILKGPPAPAPKISVQSPEASSPSADSGKEDSSSSNNNNNKPKTGGEPMSRTNSGSKTKKTSDALAQQKLLMSNKPLTAKAKAAPKPTSSKPSSAKTSPKVSPTKPASKPAPKAATGKGGRVLSKEFITDSDTDSSEEAPLSKLAAPASKKSQDTKDMKATPKVKQQATERLSEKLKPVEKSRDTPAPKTKPAPVKSTEPKIKDSIRAEAPKPIRAPKRARDDAGDDSSSSGTPLSKRFKNDDHRAPASKSRPIAEPRQRKSDSSSQDRDRDRDSIFAEPKPRKSDSQSSRDTITSRASQSSSSSTIKSKTSPVKKSSPLASSPPTNASDIDSSRKHTVTSTKPSLATNKKRKLDSTQTDKPNPASSRNRYEKSIDSSSSDRSDTSSSSDSSLRERARTATATATGTGTGTGSSKVSEFVRLKAEKFKAFYASYETLHRELTGMEGEPPEDKVAELIDMHERLSRLKREINRGVEGEA